MCPTVTSCEFRFDARLSGMVYTLLTKKVPLTLYEDKLFWLDKDVGVPYGSRTSYEHGYRDGDVVCVRGGIIAHHANVPNSNDPLSNDVDAGHDSVDDASLINILAQLMDDSNSPPPSPSLPSTSYDYVEDDLDDIEGPRVIFGREYPSAADSPSQSRPKKKKIHDVSPIPSPSPKVQKK